MSFSTNYVNLTDYCLYNGYDYMATFANEPSNFDKRNNYFYQVYAGTLNIATILAKSAITQNTNLFCFSNKEGTMYFKYCISANGSGISIRVGTTPYAYDASDTVLYGGTLISSFPNIITALYNNFLYVIETNQTSQTALGYTSVSYAANLTTIQADYFNFKASKFSDEYGEASADGGYTGGTFDDSSDTISLPTTPSMGVTSAGFVNVYNPTAGELANLGSELFPDLTFTSESPVSGSAGVTEAIEAAANALVNFGNQIPKIVDMYINSNLIQYVIDCHILPVAPTTSGTGNVKVGFKTFTPAPALVTSDYVDFDCGSLNIGEYYANFIDYAPYTKCKLFLPFVGFVDLQPEYWQSGTINVVYRFNIIDGSFMAFVISTSSKSKLSNTVIAQYGGNACVHIPITGLNYSSMVSGVVSGAQAVISAQSGVQAATRAVNSAVDVMNAKPPVQQSNSYNSTTSFLGVRTPYLLIERSVSNFSETYTDEKGVPSNISTSFSSLSGYTEATSVHLDGITGATSEELTEISELLAGGVVL